MRRKRTTKEKLLRLAEVLDQVPKAKFDMHAWRCGTQACAAGWGVLKKVFTECCLGPEYVVDSETFRDLGSKTGPHIGPWEALAEEFPDLPQSILDELFLDDPPTTPKSKAKQIRRIVRRLP